MPFYLLYVLQVRVFYLICLYTVVQEDVDRYSRLERKWQKRISVSEHTTVSDLTKNILIKSPSHQDV